MKKIILFLILAVSTLTSWAGDEFSAVAPTGQTLYYFTTTDSTVTVTCPFWKSWGDEPKPTGKLVIPSTVSRGLTTYTVTEIGDYAFMHCTGLTSVIITDYVTDIGDDAFDGCYGLTSVTIGTSVTSIHSYAFAGCSGLTSVTIPNSVHGIWKAAFKNCYDLTSVTIGNSVYYIGAEAFKGCRNLTKISIPNPNKKLYPNIASDAFSGCPGTIKSQLNTIFAAESSQTHTGFFKTGGTHTFTDNKGRKCKLYMSGYKARLTIGGTTHYGTYSGSDGRYTIRFDYDDSPYFTVNGQSSRKTTLYIRRGKIYLSETAADAENPKLGYQLYYREIDFE